MVTATRPFRIVREEGDETVVNTRFHRGQKRAWNSTRRTVAMLCGTQGGKTEFAPHWLKREMEERGPGDYLIGTSTFKLLQNKLLPVFLSYFKDLHQLGDYQESKAIFTVSKVGEYHLWGAEQDTPTRIIVFSGQSPEGIEAATAKAAWLDEAGQKQFLEETFEAVERRLAIHQGRILITTTLYNFGWLKRRIYDAWEKGDQSIDVIQFDSIENPAYPVEEWDKARATLPKWKFDLFWRGRFTKPAGAVYDCFDSARHCLKRFAIPKEWPRYTGHDFGPVNMVCLWLAQNPANNDLIIYRAYRDGGKNAGGHVADWNTAMVEGEKQMILKSVGGAPRTEDGWRDAFTQQGWAISPPGPMMEKPEQQIMCVYELFKLGRLYVFDDLTDVIDDIVGLAYKLDDRQQPTDVIENDKEMHYAAALRYIGSDFKSEIQNVSDTGETVWKY